MKGNPEKNTQKSLVKSLLRSPLLALTVTVVYINIYWNGPKYNYITIVVVKANLDLDYIQQ